jgi:chromosome segregation ATPase
MSGELASAGGGPAAVSDGDHRYQAVQAKLRRFAQAMAAAQGELEDLHRRLNSNAAATRSLAASIAEAKLDRTFVEMTDAVATALHGAAREALALGASAREVSTRAHDARATHARLYQRLDEVRSGRRYQTPKPGFFTH